MIFISYKISRDPQSHRARKRLRNLAHITSRTARLDGLTEDAVRLGNLTCVWSVRPHTLERVSSLRGPHGMPPPAAQTVSRVEHYRSRLLIDASRARIASAQELLAQSRQSMARQSYVSIVCAWCQETIRFERSAVTARGQV